MHVETYICGAGASLRSFIIRLRLFNLMQFILLIQWIGLLLALNLRVYTRARRGLAVCCVRTFRHRSVVVVVRVVFAVIRTLCTSHSKCHVLRSTAFLAFLNGLLLLLLWLGNPS